MCRRGRLLCQRQYDRFPYVPSNPAVRDRRCYEAYNIQVQGLVKRLKSTGISKVVVGISGGLDSTQTLIVAARAMESLSDSERALLSLAYFQGMTAREIAEADGIPLGTVKTRLRTALIKLRRANAKEPM